MPARPIAVTADERAHLQVDPDQGTLPVERRRSAPLRTRRSRPSTPRTSSRTSTRPTATRWTCWSAGRTADRPCLVEVESSFDQTPGPAPARRSIGARCERRPVDTVRSACATCAAASTVEFPAIVATASASGVPNITYLSLVHEVDDERLALVEPVHVEDIEERRGEPRASLILIDPVSFSEYRVTLRYERTDRRGPVFERLRDDVDKVAALSGMVDVFRLRSADIFVVEQIHVLMDHDVPAGRTHAHQGGRARRVRTARRADEPMRWISARWSRWHSEGSIELLGYRHSSVLLLDERSRVCSHSPAMAFRRKASARRSTSATASPAPRHRRAAREGRRSASAAAILRAVRRVVRARGRGRAGADIPLPSLDDPQSRLAVPAMVKGELVGVLVVESPIVVAFDDDDEAVLTMVATLIAQMAQIERADVELGPTGERGGRRGGGRSGGGANGRPRCTCASSAGRQRVPRRRLPDPWGCRPGAVVAAAASR